MQPVPEPNSSSSESAPDGGAEGAPALRLVGAVSKGGSRWVDRSDRFEVAGLHVHLLGVGGSGMSGLARLLRARGAEVSGSDSSPGEATEALEREGIAVSADQGRAWLPEACDLVVASAAIKEDHPQLEEARRRGAPVLLYAEALGRCMLGRTGVAIAGTHGKSTTTAMLGCALTDAGLDPGVIVGANVAQLEAGALGSMGGSAGGTGTVTSAGPRRGTGFRLGAEKIASGNMAGRPGVLVAEACEYNRSFHNYRPLLASISSVEADHLDCYGTLDEVVRSFREFAALLPSAERGGRLLIAHDGAHRREVTAGILAKVETIGFSPSADWVVTYEPTTRRVTLAHERERVAEWTMTVPGAHNATNAATALALATMLGADPAIAARSLGAFRGADRRMQLLGVKRLGGSEGAAASGGGGAAAGGVRVFDDYGHHPTEVDVTLRALRESERPEERGGRLICVFQPHQHSRTRHLLEEFAQSFSMADVVIVPDIYFVRDSQEERHKVTSADLVDRLRLRGVKAMHLYPFAAIVEQLQTLCRPNDVVVVMGAGPVWQIGREFLRSE